MQTFTFISLMSASSSFRVLRIGMAVSSSPPHHHLTIQDKTRGSLLQTTPNPGQVVRVFGRVILLVPGQYPHLTRIRTLDLSSLPVVLELTRELNSSIRCKTLV